MKAMAHSMVGILLISLYLVSGRTVRTISTQRNLLQEDRQYVLTPHSDHIEIQNAALVKHYEQSAEQDEETIYEPVMAEMNISDGIATHLTMGSIEDAFHMCNLTVNSTSSLYFKSAVNVWKPHFVRFHLLFNKSIRVESNPEVIQPNNWVWTYYDPDGFFPYLKWPVDFPILSFGLLDAKTLHHSDLFLMVDSLTPNCSLKLGNRNSTLSIAFALRDMTRDYLMPMDPSLFSYSYWCYLSEVPGIKKTTQYTLGTLFDFPVDFERYNCCRTDNSRKNTSELHIHCLESQIQKMFTVTAIPYILALVAFAYFPCILSAASQKMFDIGKETMDTEHNAGRYRQFHDDNVDQVADTDWVFLEEHPPINFLQIAGGMCGLVKKYPIAVSRIRRIMFVLLCPVLIFVQIYVYSKYQYETTKALIDHGKPMGYLSLMGGLQASKKNFLPLLGGPLSLLISSYVGGVLFIILPSDLNIIFSYGSERLGNFAHISPLFYSLKQLERFSFVSFTDKRGYNRAYTLFRAGICMLTNPSFWFHTVNFQFARLKQVFASCSSNCRIFSRIIMSLFIPLYIVLCLAEIGLLILYYGIPVVTFITIVVKGYRVSFAHNLDATRSSVLKPIAKLASYRSFMLTISTFLCACFVFYVFIFCTVFVASFAFVSEIIMLSLTAVIVNPSAAFADLFFGIMILYYIFKNIQSFGDGYKELLAEAVEVSKELGHHSANTYVHGDILVVQNLQGTDISKIQIGCHVLSLPINQDVHIRNTLAQERPKVIYRNHTAGIPRHLFRQLVREFRPVHIQLSKIVMKTCMVVILIAITFSILVEIPTGPSEEISEVMHVVFIVVIGVLPKMMEAALGGENEIVAKDIKLRRIKTIVMEYWSKQHEDK